MNHLCLSVTGLTLRCLLAAMLLFGGVARADVASGVAWLQGRDSATGVHRDSDLALAAETNGEAWLTAVRLDEAAQFSQLRSTAIVDAGDGHADLARLAYIRVDQGQTASPQLTDLLAAQQADGGIAPLPGFQSEALTSALTLRALDRAGRGGETAAARILGYLITAQQTDGGWLSASPNQSTVFASAQVAQILAAFRTRFELTTVLARASLYLNNARGAANAYASIFETALAVDALITLRVDRPTIEPVIVALAAAQQANGSFDNDAYVTALALRALFAANQPVVPPTRAALIGRVLAADTELPISGAQLTLSGTANVVLNSNDTGQLRATDLMGGAYSAVVSYPGMRSVEFALTLVENRTLDLGDIRMFQGTGPVGNFGLVRGVVRSAENQQPIAGAVVRIESPANQVTTDADGRYQMLQVPVGDIRLIASAAGFASRSATTQVTAQSIIEFSPSLEPIATPPAGALIRGRILHGQTNAPLAGVTVAVVAGATPVSTTTNGNGDYVLESAPGTLLTITAALVDFDTVTITAPLAQGEVLPFSPRLYPTGTTPSGANRARITGIVVNQADRQPLANAQIVVSDPSGQQALRSAEDGSFTIVGISGPVTTLAFSADAFEPATLAVSIQPLEVRDIGRVGLRPTTLQFYFPDLAIVASTLATTDPDRFTLDQSFTVQVANRGTSNLTQDFTMIAFLDGNGNGLYDAADEPEVGRVRADNDLPIGSSADIDIAVRAQLAFRDAPVAFVVDLEREVPEQDEDNNTGSSLLGCRVTPAFIGTDNIYEAWRWSGLASNPQINSLNQTPVVGQLSDDNADGVINEYDIPDIAFVAGRRSSIAPGQSALVAISGDDGRELWSRTDLNLSHFTSIALGDADNDGVAELAVVRGYRQELILLEHNGTIKWRRALDGPGIPQVLIPPPPFVYDQPIIVNLEGDNEAEVVLGREAFRGLTGEQLWEGEFDAGGDGGKPATAPVRVAFGIGSIAADVNLDGVMEVIAGRTLYDFEGRTIWHRADIKPIPYPDAGGTLMNTSGLNAIGNFDLDDFAEIVLSAGNELYLLEHTGETIWGPKFAPDFGELGAPSVADLDDDGLPEIMISSNERLTILESDGTVKWTAEISDQSGVTSATIFDFENDGLYEVIHMDEEDFRIYDALTGTVLYETRNTSLTVYEYPVVADIDGDKQAEIIITGFDYDLVAGTTPGIRVFKARNGAWADAGSVWGSHSFHIDDVAEDSVIPLLETPSWLTHNTYRVQRSPLPDPLGMPDFTVGDVQLIDQGPGLNPVVQMRVGNAGPVDAHEPPFISVFRGDPAIGGVLLAQTRLDTLRAARFQIVDLGAIALTGSGDLFAVVDQRGRANECREGNNQRVIPFASTNGLGDLQVSTDKVSYATGETVDFAAAVTNVGGLPANFRVEWLIRDSLARTTATLTAKQFTAIPAGQSANQHELWPSAGVLAGNYTVVARLFNASGVEIDQSTAVFAIAGDFSGPNGSVYVASDQSLYLPGQPVTLTYVARNLSSTEVIRLPEVVLETTGPGGFARARTFPLSDLAIESFVDGNDALAGADAPGIYTTTARLRSRLTGHQYATATSSFTRVDDPTADLRGAVEVMSPSLLQGAMQTCLYTARNLGTRSLPAQSLRKRVVALDSGQVLIESQVTTPLISGTDYVSSDPFTTAAFAAADYACVLEAQQVDGWRLLASEPFTVEGLPPAAVIVDPTSGLQTSEGGQTASFTVRLSRAPTATVAVPIVVTDASEWQSGAANVSFEPGNWDVPRLVTITGVDDALLDGNIVGTIELALAQSADPAFAGIDPIDVGITNIDNDGVAIQVQPAAIDTNESGTSADISISLNVQPIAPVTIQLVSSDLGEWTLANTSITIDASNWQQPALVTVTGVDDADLDGLQTGSIIVQPAQSDDLRFAGINPNDVIARNADNDQPAILVAPTQVITEEGGVASSFVLRLSAAPNAVVRVPIGAVDASEWQILDTEVVLDAGNFTAGVTVVVSPVDDSLVDGDQTAVLQLGPAISSDTRFNGLAAPSVQLTNLDDDLAQIVVTPTSGLIVDENGATATFVISLSDAPTAPVTIALSSGDLTEFSVGITEVQFTPLDFAPRTVTVQGLDDAEVDGNIAGLVITAAAVSGDARYAGVDPANVGVTNVDNETVQVVVGPFAGVVTSESGTTATIALRPSVVPTQSVTIALSNPDSGEWTLDRSSVEFLPANGTTPQLVVVTGVDDFELDGDIAAVIATAPAVSADTRFNGLDAADILATNLDDDVAASMQISPVQVETSETGTSASIAVTLSTRPSAEVRIALVNPDATEISFDRTELVFNPANWPQPVSFVVTGVDDTDVDGDIALTILGQAAQSNDARYAGLRPANVSVVNRDNEMGAPPAVLVTATDLIAVEGGAGGSIAVVLSRAPEANVRVVVASANNAELTVTPLELVFTPATALLPQSVQLQAVNEAVDDGDQLVSLNISVTPDSDPAFAALPAQTQLAESRDNDSAGVVLELTGAAQIIEGQATELRVRLNSQPLAPIGVLLSGRWRAPAAPPLRDFMIVPQQVQLDSSNWQSGVIVQIETVVNDVLDPTQFLDVQAAVTAATDLPYVGQLSNTLGVEVLDIQGEPLPVPIDYRLLGFLMLAYLWMARRYAARAPGVLR